MDQSTTYVIECMPSPYTTIEPIDPMMRKTSDPWDGFEHARQLASVMQKKKDVRRRDTMCLFVNRKILDVPSIVILDLFRDVLPPTQDFDLAILNYNRLVDGMTRFLLDRKKPNGEYDHLWTRRCCRHLEDVACYLLTTSGIDKVLQSKRVDLSTLRTIQYVGEKKSFRQRDNWSVVAYLNTESPQLPCQILRKWVGNAAGVYARPLFSYHGWNVNFVQMVLFAFVVICGFFDIPHELPMRCVALCCCFEPMDGLTGKVILTLVGARLLYEYAKDPLFLFI